MTEMPKCCEKCGCETDLLRHHVSYKPEVIQICVMTVIKKFIQS